jgi:hypothetical protein
MSIINEKQKEDLRESLKEAKDALEFIRLADPLFYSEIRNLLFPSNELRIGDLVFRNSDTGLAFGMVAERNDKREFNIKDVIFNDPATIVMWSDGSKTVVKCQPGDTYSEELGLAMCIAKKYYGNTGAYNEVFKRFIPKESECISVETMRKALSAYCKSFTSCAKCGLKTKVRCKCTCSSSFFNVSADGEYIMNDDEIRDVFARLFSKKEG